MTRDPLQNDLVRLLIVCPNWLGDSVMATRLLEFLHRSRRLDDGRHLHLTWAVRRGWAPLFREDPRIDQILTVERPGRHDGWRGIPALAGEIRSENFDGMIIGPPSLRMGLVGRWAGVPLRVGYATDTRRWTLSHPVPLPLRGSAHFSQEMVELGHQALRAVGQERRPHLDPGETSLPGVAPLGSGTTLAVPRLVFAPGATYGLAKTWPLEPAVEFCRLALEEGNQLILLGDAAAGPFGRDLAGLLNTEARAQVTDQSGLVDLTGQTDLIQAAQLLLAADGFVGNDSGLMHLAAALGVPTVGIFGSSNPAWTAPLGRRTAAVVAAGFPCQPCYRRTCNQATFCLDTITGQQVHATLSHLRAGEALDGGSV